MSVEAAAQDRVKYLLTIKRNERSPSSEIAAHHPRNSYLSVNAIINNESDWSGRLAHLLFSGRGNCCFDPRISACLPVDEGGSAFSQIASEGRRPPRLGGP
jgi:hypothetical protein